MSRLVKGNCFLHVLMLLGVFILSQKNIKANSYYFNENCIRIHQKIMWFDFETADSLIQFEKGKKNLLASYLNTTRWFIYQAAFPGNETYANFKNICLKEIEQIQLSNIQHPLTLYLAGEMYMQLSIINAWNKDYTASARNIKKSYRLLKKNKEKFPDFGINHKAMGIVHVIFGSIPDELEWIANIAGIHGSVNLGLMELQQFHAFTKSNDQYTFMEEESAIILMLVQSVFENESTFKMHADEWLQRKKYLLAARNNQLLCMALTNTAMQAGYNDLSLSILSQNKNIYKFPYLFYLKGTCLLRKLDPLAGHYLNLYIQQTTRQGAQQSAHERLSWHYILESDKKNNQRPISKEKILLLKTRLLYDGGYYQRALDTLHQISPQAAETVNPEVSLEYTYRAARIHHKMGKSEVAIDFYKKTLSTEYSKGHMKANAALQLGNIFEAKKNYQAAIFYYKKCLSFKGFEYAMGIHQKAKAGLNRINYRN